jgi:hypothetical protein
MPVLNSIEERARPLIGDAPAALHAALSGACAAHYRPNEHAFDYRRFADSPEFEALAAAARALADFECATLGVGRRLPFWLNAYNALVLHAVVARSAYAGVRAMRDFFSDSRYVIGGHEFSLDDMEHGLLRVNAPRSRAGAKPFHAGDPRHALAPYLFDERAHFALYSACRSSPPPAAYAAAGFDAALEDAARAYLAAHVRVADGGATLVVPKLFDWYSADFGGEGGVRDFVIARLQRDEDIEAVDRRAGRVRLRYAEFDWTLNAA